MVGDIEFETDFTKGRSVQGKEEWPEYKTLGDTERNLASEKLFPNPNIDFSFTISKVGFDPLQYSAIQTKPVM